MRVLLLLLCTTAAHAQSGFEGELTSDKQTYAYGETITLTYTMTNASSEVVEFYASSSCGGAGLDIGTLRLPQACTLDSVVYVFDPGEANSWIWVLVPSELGIPEHDGEQEAIGYHVSDSTSTSARTTFDAPQYLGGPLSVGFDAARTDSVDAIRESVGGEVTVSVDVGDRVSQAWQVSGTALTDVIARLVGKSYVRYAETSPSFAGSVYTPVEDAPGVTVLTAPAPNPTSTSATFSVGLERPGVAQIDLIDVQGRRVAVLFDGPLAGERAFTVSTAGLPAGVYLVRVLADGVRQSHRLTVVR